MNRQIKVTIVCGFSLIVLLFLFTDVFKHSRFIGEPVDTEMTYHERRLAASKEYQYPGLWSSSHTRSVGNRNVAIGYNALTFMTGHDNVAIGYRALRKDRNGIHR